MVLASEAIACGKTSSAIWQVVVAIDTMLASDVKDKCITNTGGAYSLTGAGIAS
jgi:hypothetical protein